MAITRLDAQKKNWFMRHPRADLAIAATAIFIAIVFTVFILLKGFA